MNRQNNFYIPGLVLIMIMSTSCEKYLDKKANSTDVVPTTLADMQALLDDPDFINFSTSNYMETVADDYFLDQATYDAQGPNDQSAYTWKPFDYIFENDWSKAYYPVYVANICLERIDAVKPTAQNQQSRNNVRGSALFLRAYYFLNLAWTYAKAYDANTAQQDLGIVLRLSSNFNEPSVRANVQDTYDRVLKDARESISLLPDLPQHTMRASRAAAYGLLARTHLSMRQYDSALKYADLCLQLKNDLLDFNDPASVDLHGPVPFAKFNAETIFYTETTQTMFLIYNFTSYIDTTVYESYEPGDLRKTAFFFPFNNYQGFKGFYSGDIFVFTGLATDELYLIRAEGYARAGQLTHAMNDLNYLRSKRWESGTYTNLTAATPQEALDLILVERRKELLLRGLRWMDIKRLNKENRNIVPKRFINGQTFSLPPNDNRYALPLPKDIIEMTGIPQNPQ